MSPHCTKIGAHQRSSRPCKSIFTSAVAASNSTAFGFTCVRERDPFQHSREETYIYVVEREGCDEMSESK